MSKGEIRRGVKVVYSGNSERLESYNGDLPKILRYEKPGEWTNRPANCGALCVFDEIWQAANFLADNVTKHSRKEHFKIFHCDYEEETEDCRVYQISDCGKEFEFWNSRFPVGTQLAHRVKLLEEIPLDQICAACPNF